ncbi:hypothetical protein, partial [Cronobacter malonaticus]
RVGAELCIRDGVNAACARVLINLLTLLSKLRALSLQVADISLLQ